MDEDAHNTSGEVLAFDSEFEGSKTNMDSSRSPEILPRIPRTPPVRAPSRSRSGELLRSGTGHR